MVSHTVDEDALATVLSPVESGEFFTDYWEKQPLHISRAAPHRFDELLSIAAIDQCLSSQTTYFPAVQLTQSDKPIAADDYTVDGREILPLRLLERYASGATVVMSQAQLILPGLGAFCRAVQSALQMRCQTNVYLSPPGNQGFNPHYDTHDVFILQVSGAKTFNFYSAGAELPFTTDHYDPALKEGAEKTGEARLQAGDTLYIPRGLVHDAVAQENEPSLHITLGLYPIVFSDVLQALVQVAAEEDSEFRRALPLAWHDQQAPALAVQVEQLLGQVLTENHLQMALSRLRDSDAVQSRQACSGLLSSLHRMPRLDSQTHIVFVKQRVIGTERNGSSLRVRSFGQVLEFSAPVSDAFEWLSEQGQCRVADLPLDDNEQKLAFSGQLFTANLIEIHAVNATGNLWN